VIQYLFIPNVMIWTNRQTTWSQSPAPYDGGVVMEKNHGCNYIKQDKKCCSYLQR